MVTPLSVLALSGTLPFKAVNGITSFVTTGLQEHLLDDEGGMSYNGPPVKISTKSVTPGLPDMMDADQQMMKHVENYTAHNGQVWRKTPFLWGNINVPIRKGTTMQDYISRETPYRKELLEKLAPQLGLNPAGIPTQARYLAAEEARMLSKFPGELEDFTKHIMSTKGRERMIDLPFPTIGAGPLAQVRFAFDRIPANSAKPSNILIHDPVPMMAMRNYYDQGRNMVALGSLRPSTIFHEVGHAADLNRYGRKAITRAGSLAGQGLTLAVPLALVAGDAIKKSLPGISDDNVVINSLQKYGPEAWLAAKGLSTLYPEFKATTFADSALKAYAPSAGWSPNTLSRIRMGNGVKFGRYLLNAAVPYSLLSLARSVMNARREGAKAKEEELHKKSSVISAFTPDYKMLWNRLVVDPLYRSKIMLQNLKYVAEPIGKPTSAGVKAMLTGDTAKEFAMNSIVPATLATAIYLAARDKKMNKALEQTDATALPIYSNLQKGYSMPSATPMVWDFATERVFS